MCPRDLAHVLRRAGIPPSPEAQPEANGVAAVGRGSVDDKAVGGDGGEDQVMMTMIDPNSLWFVCWRIDGDLCGRSLIPMKPFACVDVMDKVGALYGEKNVWMEQYFPNAWDEATAKTVDPKKCVHGVPLNVFCGKCE